MYFCRCKKNKSYDGCLENIYQRHLDDKPKACRQFGICRITPPECKYLRILILCISVLFTLPGCEKAPLIPPLGDELSDTSLRGRACLDCVSLLGDWHVLSAVVPVGTSSITADIVWQGTMIEFTPDSVRFHRHDLAYPASYPGETIDVNLQFYPIKYSSDGSITIDVAQFVVFKTEAGTLILRGENIEIEILKD